ncbi:probable transcription factor At1g61730 [Pistacia vera]|uniref:probable transcription factor At1g61730 n=1 Tax=Pistacia vera TaxID=55513 RepID=UPI001263377C|nr:probable transcription factor At1g61730 [Pistacia vera]
MAPKKPNPMEELPASSPEGEEISSDEVTSSDDEQTEEPTKPSSSPQQTQKPTHSVASAPISKSSSSEEDSESECDSESTPKPIATKPMEATTSKPRSKAPAKRPNETLKKPNPMEELPASSPEDEEISSDVVTSSDDEQTEEPTNPPSPPPQQTQKPTHSVASAPISKSSCSEKDSESDSDSESESTPKPIATKPMEATTSKPRSKAPAKRHNETLESLKDSKRAKKKEMGADPDEEDQKKPGEDTKKLQPFQRVWSDEDEIAVLKGLIDFTTKKGMDPYQDTNAFHDFIKKSLHVEFTRIQVKEKIRRLKKKYENNLGKKGEDTTFSKLHEQEAYDLSRKLWGNGSTSSVFESVAKSNNKAKKNQNQKGSSESLAFCKADLNDGAKGTKMDIDNDKKGSLHLFDTGLEEFVINQGLDMIGGAKKAELEERWKKLQIAQLQLFVERTDLIKEQTELVFRAMKSFGH